MVGGEDVLPFCVTPDRSTEPLVNTIHGWGKWWGGEDLESSGGLSNTDFRALRSELHTISPFFLLQTQIGKEGNNNRQESWMNQESHSWQESPHSCLVCFPAPAASPCSVLVLDAILQEQILCLPPWAVYEPHCWRCAAPHCPPCAWATPGWAVLPTSQAGSWETGIWQPGAQGSLYKASRFLLIPVVLPLLLLFPLTLTHTFMHFTAHAVD